MAGGRPGNPRELVPAAEVMPPQQVMQQEYRLMDLIPAVDSKEKAMRWLATRGLIRNEVLCHGCGYWMALVAKAGTIDGKRWKCSKQCRESTKSIRFDSWFEKSRLDLTQCILLLYFWAADIPKDQIAHELNITHSTVVDWSNTIREVCDEDLRLHPQQMHTKNIENMWMFSKRKLQRQFGTSQFLFDSYLNEFVWRSRDMNRQHQCFARLLNCIREQY